MQYFDILRYGGIAVMTTLRADVSVESLKTSLSQKNKTPEKLSLAEKKSAFKTFKDYLSNETEKNLPEKDEKVSSKKVDYAEKKDEINSAKKTTSKSDDNSKIEKENFEESEALDEEKKSETTKENLLENVAFFLEGENLLPQENTLSFEINLEENISLQALEEKEGSLSSEDFLSLENGKVSSEEDLLLAEGQDSAVKSELLSALNSKNLEKENGEKVNLENENNFSLGDASELKNENLTDQDFLSAEKTEALTQASFENPIKVIDQRKSLEKEEITFESGKDLKADVTNLKDNNLGLTYTLQNQSMQNILSSNDQVAQSSNSTFQEMLSNQISNNIPDFVKAGKIILQENNEGTISLNLKPESLGNVKINLHLSDKNLVGEIIVSSKEAMDAFKQNLENFKQSFQQQGFESANLTLTMNDNASSNSFAQGQNQNGANEFFSRKVYSDFSLSSDDLDFESDTIKNDSQDSDYRINVVA